MKAQSFLPPHLLKHGEAEHSAFWFRFLKGRRKDVRFTVISVLSGGDFLPERLSAMAQLPAAQLKLSVPAAAPDNGASLTRLNSYHNLFCFFL